MIREANKFDKHHIIELMLEFREQSEFKEIMGSKNVDYWNTLLDNILAGSGKIFISPDKGLLMCMMSPLVWDNKMYALHELAWFVRPEARKGIVAYRLLHAYLDYAKQLKRDGRIAYFTLSKLANTENMNYGKLGFRKQDENWVQ